MQHRFIINEPPAGELKDRLKEAIVSGEGVPVIAKSLGTFSLKVVNDSIVFIPDDSSVGNEKEEGLILHPTSIYTAVSEDDFTERSIVSAIKGEVEGRDESFILTVSNNEDGFDDIPTELVLNDSSEEFTD